MRICVISDLHYKYTKKHPEDEENSKILLDFLDDIKGKYDCLILAGDIFDLWYDWKYCIVKQYFPLLVKLHEISQMNCRIIHISGNHDFWFGDFLPDYLDMELYPEYFEIIADGKRIYVCHGDTHTVNDMRYQFFRKIIRLPLIRRFFGILHPDLALGLGSKMSRSSRARKDPAPLRVRKNKGLIDFARHLINKGKADIVVMGHAHAPSLQMIDKGHYANSGDWICHHSFIEIDDGNIQLKYFKQNKGDTA